mmetsp:Transcript_25298/g.83629  ORF Transcript_25298/g.83629 Transcript_25298/m.83629 type:complete len:91 (+) Transcript_25298:602-874(+)
MKWATCLYSMKWTMHARDPAQSQETIRQSNQEASIMMLCHWMRTGSNGFSSVMKMALYRSILILNSELPVLALLYDNCLQSFLSVISCVA